MSHKLRVQIPALLLLLALPLAAQDTVFRSDSRLVVLHATVLDSSGRLVTDLPKSAFRVYENGAAQDIKVFRQEDAPVSIELVIDDSGSMTNKRQKVAASALALVEASHPDDEVSVIHFNEKSYLDTSFTHDRKQLERALSTFNTRGTTAMREAVRLAIAHLENQASEDKKALILITDGEDNESSTSVEYLVKAAQQSGILIYGVGILTEVDDDETRRAKHEIDALTQATGGQSYYLKDVSEATATAQAIANVIRNQYTLAYTPVDQEMDGTFRKIQVSIVDRPELMVRTRSGYWAGKTTAAAK
ncbi:MAG TPA: VWA domain-containing protein [Bryobacteraceae bacterium]